MLAALAALPSVLQDTAALRPRTAQSGTRDATRERLPTTQNHPNNFLAEASAMHREGQNSPQEDCKCKAAGAHCHASRAHLHIQKAFVERALTLRDAVIHPSGEHRRKTGMCFVTPTQFFRKTIILPKLELCTSASNNSYP